MGGGWGLGSGDPALAVCETTGGGRPPVGPATALRRRAARRAAAYVARTVDRARTGLQVSDPSGGQGRTGRPRQGPDHGRVTGVVLYRLWRTCHMGGLALAVGRGRLLRQPAVHSRKRVLRLGLP